MRVTRENLNACKAFVDFWEDHVIIPSVRVPYPVEYYLEPVEEYSEGKTHMSEPESGKGNVNTVEFVNQARGDTRVSRTVEFVYDE